MFLQLIFRFVSKTIVKLTKCRNFAPNSVKVT